MKVWTEVGSASHPKQLWQDHDITKILSPLLQLHINTKNMRKKDKLSEMTHNGCLMKSWPQDWTSIMSNQLLKTNDLHTNQKFVDIHTIYYIPSESYILAFYFM